MNIKKFDKIIKENPELSKLFDNDFRTAMVHAIDWENTQVKHYKKNFCLKEISNAVRDNTIKTSINLLLLSCKDKNINVTYSDIEKIVDNMNYKSLCCLPKNHTGRCLKTLPWAKAGMTSKKNKSLLTQLDWVYSTPGNDDFIYKNRSSRLFPIKLSDDVEKKIRNKTIKRKCAIPLKDGSSPLMAATCYIDLCSYLLNVEGFWELLKFENDYLKNLFKFYKKEHFSYISKYFQKKNRKISENKESINLICCVRGTTISKDDLVRNIKDDLSIQFGHVVPRSNSQMMTRGQNVVLMTRRGNLIIGDHDFLSNTWLIEIKGVLDFYNFNNPRKKKTTTANFGTSATPSSVTPSSITAAPITADKERCVTWQKNPSINPDTNRKIKIDGSFQKMCKNDNVIISSIKKIDTSVKRIRDIYNEKSHDLIIRDKTKRIKDDTKLIAGNKITELIMINTNKLTFSDIKIADYLTFIEINIITKNPTSIKFDLKNKKSKNRFTFLLVALMAFPVKDIKGWGHFNFMVYDKKENKVYRFEPHGNVVNAINFGKNKDIDRYIDKMIQNL